MSNFSDILSTPVPLRGTTPNPSAPGNFGIGGPNVPYVTWMPQGDSTRQTEPAAFLNYGQAPKSVGSISLKSVDFVQQAFLCPPWADDSNQHIMPEMLCFTVNQLDPDEASTVVLTLPKVNQLMHDAHRDYTEFSNTANGNFDPDFAKFKELIEEYGEVGLENYHHALQTAEGLKGYEDKEKSDLKRLYDLSSQDVLCWLTRFGIMRKISYQGSVINVNRGTSLEDADMTSHTDHYVQVNVCLAKRGRVANVFGPADDVTTGSRLYLLLKKKLIFRSGGKDYGEFQIVPMGSKMHDYVRQSDISYIDPSGRARTGWAWRVGVVLTPGTFSPQDFHLTNAANIGICVNERTAYENHANLPSLYVALGFKH